MPRGLAVRQWRVVSQRCPTEHAPGAKPRGFLCGASQPARVSTRATNSGGSQRGELCFANQTPPSCCTVVSFSSRGVHRAGGKSGLELAFSGGSLLSVHDPEAPGRRSGSLLDVLHLTSSAKLSGCRAFESCLSRPENPTTNPKCRRSCAAVRPVVYRTCSRLTVACMDGFKPPPSPLGSGPRNRRSAHRRITSPDISGR